MSSLSNLVGIGITTKGRWEDLETTLTHLKESGLDGLETVVIDDGSEVSAPAHFQTQFPWVRFIRFESSVGSLMRRNQIAELLSAPLYLSLDDDSHPAAGDLMAAATWLMEHPKVSALGLYIVAPNGKIPTGLFEVAPFPVRHFIGCAALIKRDLFLALGGYEAQLESYVEEPEFCLRAFQQGYETYFFSAAVICHRVVQQSRNNARQNYYLTRGEMLVPLWYYPKPYSYLRAMRFLPLYLYHRPSQRQYWKSCLKGALGAISGYLTWKVVKHRLTYQQFKTWSKAGLPNDPR